MTQGDVLSILREFFFVAVKIAGPLLVISMVLGIVVAIFQAATQIHEQTLTFVPKLLAIAIMLLLLGSWMMTVLDDFFNMIFDKIKML
ncbi:MAG: flagellar biosynthesis protein FliQ [Ruminococcus sp.]|nr:flagellar biosynthesis protein FliQ [Ruminococcus sp.]MBO5383975.1 flagellar biosynthesis protein FliQ [Ruminococcus sp.]MBR6670110.1 flagellar biosynthesis protein FliQ [Ruminococcus sp.]